MPRTPYRIVTVVGSLRHDSYNRALFAAARELAPADLRFEQIEIGEIPLYNGDVEREGIPPPVGTLRDAIAGADGLLFVTPENNHSIPGVLKNALDWASRPPGLVTTGKPAGIMGASSGAVGTARCQQHLRLVLFTLRALVMPHPEVLVGHCEERFDAERRLTDERSRRSVERYLKAFAEWVGR